MHLGATFFVCIILVLPLGPVLLQVNDILGGNEVCIPCGALPMVFLPLATFCSKGEETHRGEKKSGKLNLFQAALFQIELFLSKERRKLSCPSSHS